MLTSSQSSVVSVIIAAGRSVIDETLDSLVRQTFGQSFEIIVVSENEELKESCQEGIIFILADTPNPATKRNLGASRATGQILAFIDDDAIAPPEWLECGVQLLRDHPAYCGVGGPNLIPPGANRKEKLTDAILNTPLLGSGHSGYSKKELERTARLGEVHLCNLFVTAEAFQAVGGLNEQVGYGGEDTEFVYQARKKLNKRFFYSSRLYVYHHRREFGWSYVQQRFKLRINNGRLTWAYPELYTRNVRFAFGLIGMLLILVICLFEPLTLVVFLVGYFAVVIGYTVIAQREFFPVMIWALFVHHCTYASGIWVGLIKGGLMYSQTMRIRR